MSPPIFEKLVLSRVEQKESEFKRFPKWELLSCLGKNWIRDWKFIKYGWAVQVIYWVTFK